MSALRYLRHYSVLHHSANLSVDLALMIAGYAGDIRVVGKTAGFNVEVGEAIKVGGKDSPLLPGGQMIDEELDIIAFQGSLASSEYLAQSRRGLGAHGQAIWFFENGLPIGVPLGLNFGFCRRTNAWRVQERLFER